MIAKLLWRLFEKQFKSYYASSQFAPVDKRELRLRFVDRKGLRYYGWQNSEDLPMTRLGRLKDYNIWMSSGLTAQSLHSLVDMAEKAVENGVINSANGKPIGLFNIAKILHEIRMRKDTIRPVELIYNMAAVQLVREDEPAEVFVNSIHLEKVSMMKQAEEERDFFFVGAPEFQMQLKLLNISGADWENYSRESKLIHNLLNNKMREAMFSNLEKG